MTTHNHTKELLEAFYLSFGPGLLVECLPPARKDGKVRESRFQLGCREDKVPGLVSDIAAESWYCTLPYGIRESPVRVTSTVEMLPKEFKGCLCKIAVQEL